MPSRRHFLPDERLTSGGLDTFAAGFDRFYGNIDNLRSHWKSRGTVKQSLWFSLPWARKALSAVASLIPVRHYLDSSARTLWKRKLIGPLPGNTKNTRYWREIQSYLERSTNVALSSILTLFFFSFSTCLFYFARSFFYVRQVGIASVTHGKSEFIEKVVVFVLLSSQRRGIDRVVFRGIDKRNDLSSPIRRSVIGAL